MQTIIGDNGEVNIIGTGIEPGNYFLTLGFGRYLHLYSEAGWEALNKALETGLHIDIPVTLQRDTADIADRILGSCEPVTTGAVLVVPGPLAKEVGITERIRISRIPAGYWRLSPLIDAA